MRGSLAFPLPEQGELLGLAHSRSVDLVLVQTSDVAQVGPVGKDREQLDWRAQVVRGEDQAALRLAERSDRALLDHRTHVAG